MKDKRLELKLSVRGDGSLSRNSARSSTRSNRSNISNNSGGLPVSEIFAVDRYAAPQNRSLEILNKYNKQPNRYGYPAQSLQGLNQYEQTLEHFGYKPTKSNPYIDYLEPRRFVYPEPGFHDNYGQPQYQRVYNDPTHQIYGTMPRAQSRYEPQRDMPEYSTKHYTLPLRSGIRRVRISDLEPIVHGYGTLNIELLFSNI